MRSEKITRIDEFDIYGNLIRSKQISDTHFYKVYRAVYNTGSCLIQEVTEYFQNDTMVSRTENRYEAVYKNGKLAQWIYPAEGDTIFYTYDSTGIIKEELKGGPHFGRIFGYHEQAFPVYGNYIISYKNNYDSKYNFNELSSKTIRYDNGKEIDTRYFYNGLTDLITVLQIGNNNYKKFDYKYDADGRLTEIYSEDKISALNTIELCYQGFLLSTIKEGDLTKLSFAYELWP